MKACPAREEALNLLKKYNSEPFHIQHGLTVEGVTVFFSGCANVYLIHTELDVT